MKWRIPKIHIINWSFVYLKGTCLEITNRKGVLWYWLGTTTFAWFAGRGTRSKCESDPLIRPGIDIRSIQATRILELYSGCCIAEAPRLYRPIIYYWCERIACIKRGRLTFRQDRTTVEDYRVKDFALPRPLNLTNLGVKENISRFGTPCWTSKVAVSTYLDLMEICIGHENNCM